MLTSSGVEHSKKLPDTEHITFGIGAFHAGHNRHENRTGRDGSSVNRRPIR